VIFLSIGSHERSPVAFRSRLQNFTTLADVRKVVVVEYAPAHFAGVPFGEVPGPGAGTAQEQREECAAHDPALEGKATNWRRDTLLSFAATNGLKVMPLWDQAVPNFWDHVHPAARVKGFDCRHWCNPGTTLLNWAESFIGMLGHGRRNSTTARPRMAGTLTRGVGAT
jgi:hypothetical protein